MKINQNLLWAASEQFPLIFNYNLIEYQLESALGCLRAISFKFQLELSPILQGLSGRKFVSVTISQTNRVCRDSRGEIVKIAAFLQTSECGVNLVSKM